jgi:tetratricopeptide (TPR) repeat protein
MAQKVSDADKAKANELKEKGNKVLQAGQTDDAIDLYSEAILLDPTNHVLFSNRAACYLTQKSFKGALADANKCVEISPTWGKGYLRLGNALGGLNQIDEALQAYQKGLSLQNDAATTASLQKGVTESQKILNDRQDVKAAKDDRVSADSKKKAEDLKTQGNEALAAKNFKKAIDLYSLAINIDLDNPVHYSNRSAAYANLNMWSEAWADAQRSTFLDPKFARGWQRKGLAASKLGKFDEAKLAYNRAIDLDPTNAGLKQGLSDVLALERNSKPNPKKK